MRLTPHEIAFVMMRSRFPQTEWARGISVALAESRGVTDAIGVNDTTRPIPSLLPKTWGSYDLGLFQCNAYWHATKAAQRGLDWRDPYDNAEWAFLIWTEWRGSWNAWTTAKNGTDLAFTVHAQTGLAVPMEPIKPAGGW